MKITDVKKMKRNTEMANGTHTVKFSRIDYRTNETQDVTGVFVHVQGFRPLFIPFFENGENYQLDFLLQQLGVDSYDPAEVNKKAGTEIVCTRYTRVVNNNSYQNTSFNPNPRTADAPDAPAAEDLPF